MKREAVLVLAHADQHLEVFAPRNIDVHLARVPWAGGATGECLAEKLVEATLPYRYRELWRADRLRIAGTTRPLLPSVLADSLVVRDVLAAMNNVHLATEFEAVAWTL